MPFFVPVKLTQICMHQHIQKLLNTLNHPWRKETSPLQFVVLNETCHHRCILLWHTVRLELNPRHWHPLRRTSLSSKHFFSARPNHQPSINSTTWDAKDQPYYWNVTDQKVPPFSQWMLGWQDENLGCHHSHETGQCRQQLAPADATRSHRPASQCYSISIGVGHGTSPSSQVQREGSDQAPPHSWWTSQMTMPQMQGSLYATHYDLFSTRSTVAQQCLYMVVPLQMHSFPSYWDLLRSAGGVVSG